MNPSRESLERLERRHDSPASQLEIVLRLGDFLRATAQAPEFAAALALKGGTALNLGFGEPPRLSVDLDFNFIGAVEREAMLRVRPALLESRLAPSRRREAERQRPKASTSRTSRSPAITDAAANAGAARCDSRRTASSLLHSVARSRFR